MAKKEAQVAKTPTRKQVAHSKKEQEQLRLIYMGLGLVGVLIIIVLGFGLLQTYVFEPNSTIALVNGEEIITKDYRDRVLYERFLLEDQYQQIVNQITALPPAEENDQLSQFIRNQYQQLGSQILQQRSVIDRQTLDTLIEDKLVAAEAAKRGITVSEAEISEAINRVLAARQGGLTSAAAVETSTAQANASATAALWTPTPTFTPAPTLTSTQNITGPTATPANTPTPGPTSTPNIINETDLTTQYNNWISTATTQTGLNETQYRQYVYTAVLRDKLRKAIGNEIPARAEQALARHILVETEEEAQAVLKRLKAGEDFAALAEELSTDPGSAANGGELGFAPQGRFVQEVDEAIFSLPIGQLSDPIETQFGWHILEVLEREERDLSPQDYAQNQQQAYQDWLVQTREAAAIEDYWVPEKAPADQFFDQFQS